MSRNQWQIRTEHKDYWKQRERKSYYRYQTQSFEIEHDEMRDRRNKLLDQKCEIKP